MYLYHINYQDYEYELCALEMKRLFEVNLSKRHYLISNINYSIDTSVFFKAKIDILFQNNNKDKLLNDISHYSCSSFKVEYVSICKVLSYNQRMELVKDVSQWINGVGTIENPNTLFGITYIDDLYYFGILDYPSHSWKEHQNKPQSYSQSLDVRIARSLCNIAIGQNRKQTILDPLCGVGTVVLEGKYLGLNIEGSDISKGCVWKSNRNLKEFGFEPIVIQKDFLEETKSYDALIMDIPYNLYSKITKKEQYLLMEKTKEVCHQYVLITYEEFDDDLKQIGWNIQEKVFFQKQKMKRYIYLCI